MTSSSTLRVRSDDSSDEDEGFRNTYASPDRMPFLGDDVLIDVPYTVLGLGFGIIGADRAGLFVTRKVDKVLGKPVHDFWSHSSASLAASYGGTAVSTVTLLVSVPAGLLMGVTAEIGYVVFRGAKQIGTLLNKRPKRHMPNKALLKPTPR